MSSAAPSPTPPAAGASLSMQARIVVLVLAGVTAAWLIAMATVAWRTEHELSELLDGHLAQAAAVLVTQQGHEFEDDTTDDAPTLHRYAPQVAFQVWHEGKLVLHSANAPTSAMSTLDSGFETRELPDGATWRIFTAQGTHDDLRVHVGERVETRRHILGTLLKALLLPLGLALPLLGLAAWWAVRQGLAPLRALTRLLARRPPGSAEPVALAHPPREVQALQQALNDLLARIATLIDKERRFTADAAHELRTPIAAIRAQAQVARAAGTTDPATQDHALRSVLEGCDRAARLVDQLLQLARLDAGTGAGASGPTTPPTRLDLAALTRRIVADRLGAAQAQGQEVEIEGPDHLPIEVAGDEALLGALLRNLVDNAVRYAGPGARIALRLSADPRPSWQIEDSGPGLSEAEQARLGERFFRALGQEASGSGLGWSIVRRIAGALRLDITVDRSPELGGLRVRVDWP